MEGRSKDQCMELLDMISKDIKDLEFSNPAGNFRISSSFGVTNLRPNEVKTGFIKRCDLALYQAKKNGRDRIEYLEPVAG